MLDTPNSHYRILDAATLAGYLATLPAVRDRLGGGPDDWRIRDVADGNLNSVFLVDGPHGGLCVKQALPYARIHGEGWPLDINRAIYENAYSERLAPHVGALAPEILHFDAEQFVIVMEKLEPHIILRRALIDGVRYPKVPAAVADYIARASFFTSDLAASFEAKAADVALFSRNLSLQRISADLIFTDPYQTVWRNKVIEPHLAAWGDAFRSDLDIKTAVARLRAIYFTKTQSLIHGDLHSGSVMVTADDTRVIDGEFAWVGPSGFDVGNFIAHYAMAWFAKARQPGDPAERAGFRDIIAEDIVTFHETFRRRFLDIWRTEDNGGDAYPAAHFAGPAGAARLESLRQAYLDDIFRDAIGFLALKIIRRVLGYAQIADFLVIAEPEAQARAKAGALALARSLLLHPDRYPDIAAIVGALPRFDDIGLDPRPSRSW
ncbi:S-methyl-5-thioribose kinase [Pleomorphomonas carboxyditropha]|uniref:S-methyl-5-thioribose kinase n=1 Tax=Pleomorphomonas carboxyditropha TaxID=2023338 RepID=UPI0013FE37AB|nr:S-methyl-5-thioribose kinase [Pleomorphomonas carboxyditropha]